MRLHHARFDELDTTTLYEILRLRVAVFVVEQRCAYPELDGRDHAPDTRHVWLTDGEGRVASYLRTTVDAHGRTRIGRVVTAPDRRGAGLAGRLVRSVVERADGPVLLHAQAHLCGWYGRMGFVADGPGYDDAGIAHVPMRLRRVGRPDGREVAR